MNLSTTVWLSVDGASRLSGVARWRGTSLVSTTLVKGVTWSAWRTVVEGASAMVVEDGFTGKSRKTGIVLGKARGRIEAFGEVLGCELVATYQPAAWRRLIGISTAASREVQKRSARVQCQWLASHPATRPAAPAGSRWNGHHLPGLANVSIDEQEAALLGLAWLVDTDQI